MAGKRRSEGEPRRVTAGFGQRALDLAASVGKTKQDLMEAAKISVSTMNRLLRDEGAALSAMDVKNALRGWGVDVLKELPPVYADEDGTEPSDEMLREWFEVGKRLRVLASDQRFRIALDDAKELVRAHELVAAEGSVEFRRRKP